MSKSTAKKASSSVNYQDDVNTTLEREHDIDAIADEENEEDDEGNATESASQVTAAVQKVSFDFMTLLSISYWGYYSSFEKLFAQYAQLPSVVKVGLGKSKPQMSIVVHCEPTWFSSLTSKPAGPQLTKCFVCLSEDPFSSFVNYLSGCALDYRPIIDSFSHIHRDLWQYSLSNEEWEAIELVAEWLKCFHMATTQMSATCMPMLSTTHAVFRGFQDDIRNILSDLPDTASPSLKKGLMDAHLKLSDYYYKIDASPFYLWSSRKSYNQFILIIYLWIF